MVQISSSLEAIMLNMVTPNAKHLPNFIVLLGKQYIYVNRCNEKLPIYENFLAFVHSLRKTEEHIARQKDKLNFHKTKWSFIEKSTV